ncbi:MAG: type 4a pilus biogenesis protein PilO [Nitrospirae bacterium]|nr:type 4a pilus biogenesis protein PilO [Nitrospirota bacterium]
MKNQGKAFYIILAVVIVTGLIFSLYAFSKIKAIRELRAAIKKSGAEHELAIAKNSDSSTDIMKFIPQRMWTTEFIETAYTVSRKYGIRDLLFEQKSADNTRRQTHGNSPVSLRSYPVRMTFHAGYREMADFIQELQGFEKLVTIESLMIRREKSSLAVEMTASTYAMEAK